ncbi:MAG: sulfide/dihydroorotate dehydrogenase-like FAD/NAD-binding protein [Acidimicrobiia bacterium]
MSGRFLIREASTVGPGVSRLIVEAPRVADHAHPGQFVIVRATADGERIPLTICEHDPDSGTIVLVVQDVGRTSRDICSLETGDELADVLGPLGLATQVDRFGTCIVVAGGVGTAIALPVARSLAEAGNEVIAIWGFGTADQAILTAEIEAAASRSIVVTEDGSAGEAGLVTNVLADIMKNISVDRVFAVGPIGMMKAVADLTRPAGIPTIASLNPIMVDGTGMCGGCRVSVGGETRFACVDGHEFDAHLVDFDQLAARNTAYRSFERCQIEVANG